MMLCSLSLLYDITTKQINKRIKSNLFQSHVAADDLVDLILWIQINVFRQLMTVNLNAGRVIVCGHETSPH